MGCNPRAVAVAEWYDAAGAALATVDFHGCQLLRPVIHTLGAAAHTTEYGLSTRWH
jgi:hypothetical protein